MRYLTFTEIWKLHDLAIARTGGSYGLLHRSMLEIAVAKPNKDRCPTVADKAAVLWWYLWLSEAFVDGNKRTAYAAMEVFLLLNGWKVNASVDEQKKMILELAEGNLKLEDLAKWLECHVQPQGA